MEIKKVAIVGSGLIGSGWTAHLLCKGVTDITLYDVNTAALDKGKAQLTRNLDFLKGNGVITQEQYQRYLSLPKFTLDLAEAARQADIIIENGPENLAVKQQILANVEAVCRPDAIITSSTSGIMVNRIVAHAVHPERILGAHPYHPVYLLPLLEIVKNDRLEDTYLNAALDFFKSVDKKPVVMQKESPGYIGSRLMFALFREAVQIVSEGVCDVEGLDTAFTFGPGLRYALMGPFMVYQLTGGSGGIQGLFDGPMWEATKEWMPHLSRWTEWPKELDPFFRHDCKEEVDAMMAHRKPGQGQTNEELLQFRDTGLVKILKHHELL